MEYVNFAKEKIAFLAAMVLVVIRHQTAVAFLLVYIVMGNFGKLMGVGIITLNLIATTTS